LATEQQPLKLLIPHDQILARIYAVGDKLNHYYQGRELTLVMVMKGSICLTADLIRCLTVPCAIEYVQCSSYGARGASRGALTIAGLDALNLKGKDVLLVDDIYDSGTTLAAVIEALRVQQPRSLRTLVLLAKRVSRNTPYMPDDVLFEIDDQFVVGYGLDYKEQYRGLPGVYAFHQELT
jgi:hypoxanthine phosphoribosyltransferase